jgi:hypothetical protein
LGKKIKEDLIVCCAIHFIDDQNNRSVRFFTVGLNGVKEHTEGHVFFFTADIIL